MQLHQKIIKPKIGLLELAKSFGNIAAACKTIGVIKGRLKRIVISLLFVFYAISSLSCAELSTKKHILIIGAGPSGLVATKSALECGLEPIVLEQAKTLGGLWCPNDGLTWYSMRTNISRYTTMFSDFPWPDNTPIFPNQRAVYHYLQNYVEHFGLASYIQLGSCVTQVKKRGKRWKVSWKNRGRALRKEVDFVIVASGVFSKPFIPDIKGINEFKGTILHSKAYKSPGSCINKRVVVVGGSFSGAEIAADLYQSADHVLNVIRHPMYVLERYVQPDTTKHKLPLDLFLYKRPATTDGTMRSVQEKNLRSNQFLSSLCSKQTKICKLLATKPTSTDPPYVAISDDYLTGIVDGRITVISDTIARLDATGIVFENGQRKDAEVIIFCTGYQLDLPFLDTSTQKALSFSPEDKLQPVLLHKLTFHPKLPNMHLSVSTGDLIGV